MRRKRWKKRNRKANRQGARGKNERKRKGGKRRKQE